MKIIKHVIQVIATGMILFSSAVFAQQTRDWQLEKMPSDLENDYALSSLPPNLRNDATVYLLDPTKGYYMARKGTNGFSAFVERTDWSRGEFVQDMYAAEGFDSIGSKTLMPVFFEIAAMRASGKYTALQIKDIVVQRVKEGIYKAPAKTGVCYMLGPLMRANPGQGMMTMVMPHYMFYAPYVDDVNLGEGSDIHQPFIISTGSALDKAHSIFNYIGMAAGETEKAKIVQDNKELLKRLAAYKPCLKVDLGDDMKMSQ